MSVESPCRCRARLCGQIEVEGEKAYVVVKCGDDVAVDVVGP